MSEKWIWLPDWASNLGIWEDDLMDVAPSANHIYVQYSQLAEFLEHPMDIPELKKSSTVVAWGLGALSLLCSGAGPQKGQKWILLSPYADFCDEIGVFSDEIGMLSNGNISTLCQILHIHKKRPEGRFLLGLWA